MTKHIDVPVLRVLSMSPAKLTRESEREFVFRIEHPSKGSLGSVPDPASPPTDSQSPARPLSCLSSTQLSKAAVLGMSFPVGSLDRSIRCAESS